MTQPWDEDEGRQSGRARLSVLQSVTANVNTSSHSGSTIGTNSGSITNVFMASASAEAAAYLRKLGPVSPRVELDRIMSIKGPVLDGTCDWLFEKDSFKQWRDPSQGVKIMRVHGDPGKGKTMILRSALEHLQQHGHASPTRQAASPIIVYFFC